VDRKSTRLLGRTRQETSCPAAARVAARWEPMKPLAPVTRQREFFGSHEEVFFSIR
jgi:hypothetical protein